MLHVRIVPSQLPCDSAVWVGEGKTVATSQCVFVGSQAVCERVHTAIIDSLELAAYVQSRQEKDELLLERSFR